MKLLKKESLEINFPILPIPNNIKDENEFEDITYIQGKSWISLKASDCKYIWDFFPVFSNEAFRYYLPAVIYISFEELIKFQKLKDSDLLVDCTCQNMIGRMRENFLLFSYEPFWNGYLILARRIADLIHMTIKNALLGYHY